MVLHVSVFKNKFCMKKKLNVGTFPPFALLGWELFRVHTSEWELYRVGTLQRWELFRTLELYYVLAVQKVTE